MKTSNKKNIMFAILIVFVSVTVYVTSLCIGYSATSNIKWEIKESAIKK
jgi:hypothetical protein